MHVCTEVVCKDLVMTREGYITKVYKRLDPRQRQKVQIIQESEKRASGQWIVAM